VTPENGLLPTQDVVFVDPGIGFAAGIHALQ
jgi:hypothetical protein